MASWLNGKVVDNKRLGEDLTSLIVKVPFQPFEPGQFVRVGLEIDGEIIARPYSLVNTSDEELLEVYFNIVEEGPLSPLLYKLKPGDEVLIADNPSGFLTVSGIPQARHLWMIATGTGIGPFLSILKSQPVWSKFDKVVLAYSVRTIEEMAYLDLIEDLKKAHKDQFCFIPVITRQQHPNALSERIPQSILNGNIEKFSNLEISAENSHVMMCGSADMIKEVSEILVSRGMKKHRRRDPGHFTTEKYH